MSNYRTVKHSKECKYIYDTYRVWDVTTEQEALAKCFELTGVQCDYALKGAGAFDVGIIDTSDL